MNSKIVTALVIGFILCIIGLCVSCNVPGPKQIREADWEYVTIDHYRGQMTTIRYRGHRHIVFTSGSAFGMEHDPDCECFSKIDVKNKK